MGGRLLVVGVAAAAVSATVRWLRRRRRSVKPTACSLHQRKAKVLPRGRPLASGPDQLSIVSYNILCQRYATGRRFPHCFAQYLDPEYRWQRLTAELAAFGADVIALQEVTVDRWPELEAYMASLGYAGIAQARHASQPGSEFMLAVFFKTDKIRLVWCEERSRALLAALEVAAPGPVQRQVVWLANVHLEGSPYRPNDRVSQLKSALHRLELHMGGKQEAEAADVVICGDFNSGAQDSPCWLLRRGRLERNHTDACCPQVPTTKESIAHPFALHEVYEAAGCKLQFTRKVGPTSGAVLDFIWCSRHIPVAAVMRPLQQELRQLVDKCYMPNRCHPSDHLPLGALLQLSGAAGTGAAAGGAAGAAAAAAISPSPSLIHSASGSLAGGSDTS